MKLFYLIGMTKYSNIVLKDHWQFCAAVNSDPNVAVSTNACLLLNQSTGVWLHNCNIPVAEQPANRMIEVCISVGYHR
jgi:hypothetical protein